MIAGRTYESKPQLVEAVQWLGDNESEIDLFMAGAVEARGEWMVTWPPETGLMHLRAGRDGAQGWVPVPEGYWILRRQGDHSDYWPMSPKDFAEKYAGPGLGMRDHDGIEAAFAEEQARGDAFKEEARSWRERAERVERWVEYTRDARNRLNEQRTILWDAVNEAIEDLDHLDPESARTRLSDALERARRA